MNHTFFPHPSQYISSSITIQCTVYSEFGKVFSVGYKTSVATQHVSHIRKRHPGNYPV